MKTILRPASLLLLIAVAVGAYGITVMWPKNVADSTEVSEAADNDHEKDDDFKDLMDRFSYAYGADLAEKFKLEGVVLNVDRLAEAMQSAFDGEQTKMSADEIAATIDLYRSIHIQKKEAEWAIAAEKNLQEGEQFLAENAGKEGVVVTDSGLQYKVIIEGSGDYKPTEDDEVTVHYRGTFVDGTEFDSTYTRDVPFRGTPRQLIEGWSEALQMMSEGAKWELYVPTHLAYGERGSEPYVGPNAVLLFEVELLSIEKSESRFLSDTID